MQLPFIPNLSPTTPRNGCAPPRNGEGVSVAHPPRNGCAHYLKTQDLKTVRPYFLVLSELEALTRSAGYAVVLTDL